MLMASSEWTRIALGLIPATRRASWSRTASSWTYFMGCIERVSSAVGRHAGKGVYTLGMIYRTGHQQYAWSGAAQLPKNTRGSTSMGCIQPCACTTPSLALHGSAMRTIKYNLKMSVLFLFIFCS